MIHEFDVPDRGNIDMERIAENHHFIDRSSEVERYIENHFDVGEARDEGFFDEESYKDDAYRIV